MLVIFVAKHSTEKEAWTGTKWFMLILSPLCFSTKLYTQELVTNFFMKKLACVSVNIEYKSKYRPTLSILRVCD